MKYLRQIVRQILLEEVDCWDGYSPGAKTGVKTKPGTGKNKGKRVNNCEEIDEKDCQEAEDIMEAIVYHTRHGVGVEKNVFRPGSTAFFALLV